MPNWLLEKVLQREKIYIFPNRFGFLYLGVIVVMILVGATYNNNLIFLLGFFLFSVFVSSMVQTHNNIKGVSVEVLSVEDCFCGDKAKVTIAVKNNTTRSKQSLRVVPRKKNVRGPVPGKVDILYRGETVKSYFFIVPENRGVFELKDLEIYTVYPMGLFYSWKYQKSESSYYVYPKATDAKITALQKPFEEISKESKDQSDMDFRDDFKEHRTYQVGESSHHIDWRLYARRKEKMVKVFESPAGEVVSFSLRRLRHLSLEESLSQLSYWVKEAKRDQKIFELVLGAEHLPADAGARHAKKALRKLAAYSEVADAG